MASTIQSAWIQKVGPPGPSLGWRWSVPWAQAWPHSGDGGARNLGLLHGLGWLWVHEGCPRPPASWCSSTCEFNGGLGGGSPRPPPKLKRTLQTSPPWEWGTSSHRYRCSHGLPGACPLLLLVSLPPPQEEHTAWAGLSMGGWALGKVPRRRAYPPSSPGCPPSPRWLVGPLWDML